MPGLAMWRRGHTHTLHFRCFCSLEGGGREGAVGFEFNRELLQKNFYSVKMCLRILLFFLYFDFIFFSF